MTEMFLDSYHLHSLTTPGLPTLVKLPLQGLEAPEVRVDAYNNPGEDGQTVANVLLGGRLITLEGSIKGATAATYRANRQEFNQLVGPQRDSRNRPVPRVLKLTDAAGDEYRINVIVQSLRNPDQWPTRSDWQLHLRATGPLQSETQSSLVITLPEPGGLVFTDGKIDFTDGKVLFGSSAGGSGTATNTGTLPAYPILTFAGPLPNPVLHNDTVGAKLGLDLTLGLGDEVVVDMLARTIVQGGSTNRMAAKSTGSSFWALAPEANNLRFAADSFESGTVTISWRSAFAGI